MSASNMVAAIHRHGRVAMVDLLSLEEGRAAYAVGADFIATTLSGYTCRVEPTQGPDLALVEALAAESIPVVSEGRIATPYEAAAALAARAFAVTVGTTLTRPELVAAAFVQSLRKQAGRSESAVSAPDVTGSGEGNA